MLLTMKQLCEQLKGWNFRYYKDKDKYGDYVAFNFYSNNSDAILTMLSTNGKIEIANDVEYWSEDYYTDYEPITLKEYENRLKQEV